MKWFLTLLFCSALYAQQPPLPPTNTIVHVTFTAPVQQSFTVEWTYTNIWFPVQSTTNLQDTNAWVLETNVYMIHMSVTFSTTNAPWKAYRVGQAQYYGPWYLTTTN